MNEYSGTVLIIVAICVSIVLCAIFGPDISENSLCLNLNEKYQGARTTIIVEYKDGTYNMWSGGNHDYESRIIIKEVEK